MPRLNHRKTRTGCQRCKTRKVKCDEARPRCSACARHNVPCVYAHASPGNGLEKQERPTPPQNGPYYEQPKGDGIGVDLEPFDHTLELRLMHEWTAYACKTFSTTWEFWYYQAPLLALEYRYLLDAMLAIAALHASKQPPSQWNPIEGRIMVTTDQVYTPERTGDGGTPSYWKQLSDQKVMDDVVNSLNEHRSTAHLGTKRSRGMVTASRAYFDRAIDGYRHAIQDITMENIEAVFTTSILVSFNALFALNEGAHDSILPPLEASFWLRLGRGNYWIIQKWRELEGYGWMARCGVLYGEPDLSDDEWIFAPEHAEPFEKLLTFAADLEVMSDEDRNAYQKTLSYLGATYKAVTEDKESPLATNRRLTAMPSKCPPRFVDLVEAKAPRAMVMLAHVFATLKLASHDSMWFQGIAELQVPIIYDQLPVGWRELMAWPMAVARGEIDPVSRSVILKESPLDGSLRS